MKFDEAAPNVSSRLKSDHIEIEILQIIIWMVVGILLKSDHIEIEI